MTRFTNTYKPLPKELTIRESGVHGNGLFAIADIAKDVNLGMIRVNINDEWIRTPLGGFINHSKDPNCIHSFMQEDTNYMAERVDLITLHDIKAGDEILLSYTLPEYAEDDLNELQGLYNSMKESIDGR